jgi:uncharacterized Zn-binding protein involved in type VI secretion
MRRYHITRGASTTAGGKVVSASSHGHIDGKTIALEGDSIYCPACKSTGLIACAGPRIPELWNGRHVALEGDLCVCKCSRPPLLVPSQSLRYQDVESNDVDVSGLPSGSGQRPNPPSPDIGFDMHFVIKGKKTGKPLANVGYKITLEDGTTVIGRTDENGLTEKASANHPTIATIIASYYDDDDSTALDTDCGCDACCSDDSGKGSERAGLGRAFSWQRIDFRLGAWLRRLR